MLASVDLGMQGYSEDAGKQFQRRLLEKASSLPGIQSAGIINSAPLTVDVSSSTIYVEGRPAPRASEAPDAYVYEASPGYFRTMQTRFVAGRDFEDRDKAGIVTIAIVNSAFAGRLLSGENPLGKRFRFGPDGPLGEIVGVVEDGKYQSLNDNRVPVVFSSIAQRYNPSTTLVVRSGLPADQVLKMVRGAFQELDASLPLTYASSFDESLNYPLFPAHVAATVLGLFGLLAIALAATGMYGLMAYAVSRRTREIGVRMALGAVPQQVLTLVLRRMTILFAAGMALGCLAVLAGGGFLGQILYGVSPQDPATYLISILVMAFVALLAYLAPARRALRIDPAMALREE